MDKLAFYNQFCLLDFTIFSLILKKKAFTRNKLTYLLNYEKNINVILKNYDLILKNIKELNMHYNIRNYIFDLKRQKLMFG